MNDIIKIVQALEDSGILLKEQKGGFLSMLLGTLGASLLGDLLTKHLSGKGIVKAGEGTMRAGYGSSIRKKALIPGNSSPHPLTNFEIKEYYENEPRFNGVYSRDNLPKTIKNGAYVINLDEYADVGTLWIALYVINNEITYFNSFGVEHIPNEIMHFSRDKNIKTNILCVIIINSVSEEYGKYYPQVLLHDCFYSCVNSFQYFFKTKISIFKSCCCVKC